MLPSLFEFHKRVSGRMAAHLQLVGENTNSSLWLAGALLSKDPAKANAAAVELVEHLCRTPASKRTSFETTLFEDQELWKALEDFSLQKEPSVLWGSQGRFAPLYRFLAARYLANPDHVLDVERQHAVWQWVLLRRRALKLKSLNAWLKLGEYLRGFGNLPPHTELLPYLNEVKQNFVQEYQSYLAGGEVAKGLIFDAMYHERLGLSAQDVQLLKEGEGGAPQAPRTFDTAWSNYVRWTFIKGKFYSFPKLKANLYLYVVENKSLAGREARAGDEASGRPLAVCWFESHLLDGVEVVRRVDRECESLRISMCTIAEILIAAGCAPPAGDLASREQELLLEARYSSEERLVWKAEHLWQEADPWIFRLRTSDPAEESFLDETPAPQLTKMALARLLELTAGHDRRRAWNMSMAALLAALA